MRAAVRRLALLVSLATLVIAGSVPDASAAETVRRCFRTQSGPVRISGQGSGNPIPTGSIPLDVAVAGLPAAGKHRLVGSARPCSKAPIASAKVFVMKLGPAGTDGATVKLDPSTPLPSLLTMICSVRLFTDHSGSVHVACAKAIPRVITEQEAGREIVLGVLAGTIKGVAAFLVDLTVRPSPPS